MTFFCKNSTHKFFFVTFKLCQSKNFDFVNVTKYHIVKDKTLALEILFMGQNS